MNEILRRLDDDAKGGDWDVVSTKTHATFCADAAAFIRAQNTYRENAETILRAARLALKSAAGLDHYGAVAIRMITDFLEHP